VFERYSRPQLLDNEIVGRVWSFRDITEHKRAEQALRESELRLQRFVAEAPVGLCILHENWRVITANLAFCQLTGYEVHEIIGSTYPLYTHPEDLSANIRLTEEFYRGIRSGYTYEKRYIRKSGEIIWVLIKTTRIDLPDRQGPLLLAAVQDITELSWRWKNESNSAETCMIISFKPCTQSGCSLKPASLQWSNHRADQKRTYPTPSAS
jgi:PAS domain S-box-containing protein